ncbi:MAG: hypothetical protein ACQEUT_16100 [Bacillota bacterium]
MKRIGGTLLLLAIFVILIQGCSEENTLEGNSQNWTAKVTIEKTGIETDEGRMLVILDYVGKEPILNEATYKIFADGIELYGGVSSVSNGDVEMQYEIDDVEAIKM